MNLAELSTGSNVDVIRIMFTQTEEFLGYIGEESKILDTIIKLSRDNQIFFFNKLIHLKKIPLVIKLIDSDYSLVKEIYPDNERYKIILGLDKDILIRFINHMTSDQIAKLLILAEDRLMITYILEKFADKIIDPIVVDDSIVELMKKYNVPYKIYEEEEGIDCDEPIVDDGWDWS